MVSHCHASSPQARVFSSSNHVRALAAGEVDAVVGWSGADPLLPASSAGRLGGLKLGAAKVLRCSANFQLQACFPSQPPLHFPVMQMTCCRWCSAPIT